MLHSLQTACGLGQIMPYVLQFVSTQMNHQVGPQGSTRGLRVCLKFYRALIGNDGVQLEYYLPQIFQPILRTMLTPVIAAADTPVSHMLLLKRQAAQVLAELLWTSARFSPALIERVVFALRRQLHDLGNSIPTLVGAVMGLRAVGTEAISAFLLPILPDLCNVVDATLTADAGMPPSDDRSRRLDCCRKLVEELQGSVADFLLSRENQQRSHESTEVSVLKKLLALGERFSVNLSCSDMVTTL
eukprot:Polyplicarium_translucidae@DN174_c0_g1_i1.p1